jgi:hypothetical protein
MEIDQIVQQIQYTLAPAIMISSSALLLLGFQNKFSALFNRFRMLNQEKRSLVEKTNKSETEALRLESLGKQLPRLTRRASHVKNAIVLTYAAIISFVTTSVLLFLHPYTHSGLIYTTLAFCLLGLLLILISSFFMIAEVLISFNILILERKS